MRGPSLSWCVIGVIVGGCLDVPAHDPCAPDDRDCDGYGTEAANPAAVDCNDQDAAINPGAADVAGNAIDEDCIGDGNGMRLAGVSGDEAHAISGALEIGFGSPTRMPMSLRIGGGANVLATGSACLGGAEEAMGVSLYPAFVAHARTLGPLGQIAMERRGPAMATALVTWRGEVLASGASACDRATAVDASVRFTVLPGQRLIRQDLIGIDTAVTRCNGCANPGTMPIFTSYLALVPSFDQIIVDAEAQEGAVVARMLGGTAHRVCVRQTAGTGHIAVSWSGAGNGIRLRSTTDNATALVYDWVQSAAVAANTYEAVTSIIVDASPAGPCRPELIDVQDDVVTPPQVQGLRYEPALGTYTGTPVAGALAVLALDTIAHGITVRVPGFGARGVTVWRQVGMASPARLVRDWSYLAQHDAVDGGTTVVWLPGLAIGDRIIIAEPGHEPAP